MTASDRGRIEGEAAFVLHAQPFRETSLIADVISRNHGRIALVARGARRPRSPVRGLLMGFQPLEMAWLGRGEVRTLAKVEWSGGQPLLQGQALLLGYYMNELLLKLLPRDDPHPALFDAYATAVRALTGTAPTQASLRRFEITLLRELGYGLTLDQEADTGRAVDPAKRYHWIVERGAVEAAEPFGERPAFSGRVLQAIAHDVLDDAETLAQCKQLMRMLIGHYLGGQALSSRRVFRELQEL